MNTCINWTIIILVLSHLSIIGTLIKSPVCSKSIWNSKKMGEKLEFQKKSHMKFQKNGKKNGIPKKNSHEIPKNGGKIGIFRIFLEESGSKSIY